MQVSPVGQLPDRGAWTYEAKLCLARISHQEKIQRLTTLSAAQHLQL